MTIKKTIYIGKTRRKVSEVSFEMSQVQKVDSSDFKINASIVGFPEQFNRNLTPGIVVQEKEKNEPNPSYSSLFKEIEASCEFDSLVLAMAYFRQMLRLYLEQNSGIKLFELFEGNLEALEFDDIFWTHDCVPDE